MPGTSIVVQPSSALLNPPWAVGRHCAVFGAATALAALTDGSDASYIGTSGPDGGACIIGFPSIVLPANSIFYGCYAVVRVVNAQSPAPPGVLFTVLNADASGSKDDYLPNTAAFTNLGTDGTHTLNGGAMQITPAMLAAGMQLQILFGNSVAQVSEVWFHVDYDPPPSCALTAPTAGSTLLTTTPTFTWTYTPPAGTSEAQERFRLTITRNDGTNQQVYDSGEVFSNQNTFTVSAALPSTVQLTASLTVANVGSNGRYSAPSTVGFNIWVPLPAIPKVTPTWDPVRGRVRLDVQGMDNMIDYAGAGAEGTPGASLFVWSNCTPTQSTVQLYTPPGAAHSLSHSWRATSAAAGDMAIDSLPAACLAGQNVTGFFAAKNDPASPIRSVAATLAFLNASGGVIGSTVTGIAVPEVAGGWVVPTVSTVAPAGTATVVLGCTVFAAAGAGENHDIAALEIAPVPLAQLLPRAYAVPVWTRGGVRPFLQLIVVQRSYDGGDTWTPVRFFSGLSPVTPSQQTTFVDYEAAPLANVQYRAQVQSNDPNGNPIASPWSAFLPNPGFESNPITEWIGSNLTPALNTFWARPGRGRQALVMTIPPLPAASVYQVYGGTVVQQWHTTARFRGWWWAMNVVGLKIVVLFADVNFNPTGIITILGPSTITDPTPSPYQLFDSGDMAIPPGTLTANVTVQAVQSASQTDNGAVLIDDFECLIGGAYVTTVATQSWLKNPLVLGQNIPIDIEPKSSTGGGIGSSLVAVQSEAQAPETLIYGEGNPSPIVLHDVVPQDTFKDIAFFLPNDAAYEAFDAMHRSQQTLLLQNCQGDAIPQQAYVQIVGVRRHDRLVSQDQHQNQRHRIVCSMVKVAVP